MTNKKIKMNYTEKALCNIRAQSLFLWPSDPWKKILLAMLETIHNSSNTHFCWQESSIELILVNDAKMAEYNQQFLECYGPTNVLSFPNEPNELDESSMSNKSYKSVNTRLSGTIFLSVDTLQRECVLYGQTVNEHAKRLLAHAVAHLMGYDHGLEMDAICQCMEDSITFNELSNIRN